MSGQGSHGDHRGAGDESDRPADRKREEPPRGVEVGAGTTAAVEILDGGGSSLLEAVDSLLNRGVLLEGDLVLGLADVDLIYLRLTTLLAAADRILGRGSGKPPPEARSVGYGPAAPGIAPPTADRCGRAAPYEPASAAEAEAGETSGSAPSPDGGMLDVGEELASSRAEPTAEAEARSHPTAGVEELRGEVERTLHPISDRPAPPRWNAAPEEVERSVARLVLALVEFLRKLMERQAIRRMEEGTLTEDQVERLGQALMRLEETVHDMARRFGLSPEELNLDLGPLGHLT